MTPPADPPDESANGSTKRRHRTGTVAEPEAVDQLAADLRERGVPFTLATVVRREAPVSAHVGDRAVITTDGEVVGWIGGVECAQSVVVEAAERVRRTGDPILLGLAPDPATVDRPGLEAHEMTCHSGGTLEVFIEPVGPLAQLTIIGNSAVAQSLARLAESVAFDVTVVDPEAGAFEGADRVLTETDPDRLVEAVAPGGFVVVASMGAYDERGVAAGVRLGAQYLGLVASDVRADAVIDRAAAMLDLEPALVREAVTCPAGVEIAAETPAEIAVSILAEVIDARRSGRSDAINALEDEAQPDEAESDPVVATDPVCHMTVPVEEPPATVEHEGETYYFCCPGCADAFTADPDAYVETVDT